MDDLFQCGMSLYNLEMGGVMENSNYVVTNEPTKVNVTLGYTLNLGNFQSLRLDLGVVDSKREGENTDEAFERVYKFVEDKLTEKISEAKTELSEE
jgi:hypothetical protein